MPPDSSGCAACSTCFAVRYTLSHAGRVQPGVCRPLCTLSWLTMQCTAQMGICLLMGPNQASLLPQLIQQPFGAWQAGLFEAWHCPCLALVCSLLDMLHLPLPSLLLQGTMMHDFAITESYAIFIDCPLMFDPAVSACLPTGPCSSPWHLQTQLPQCQAVTTV